MDTSMGLKLAWLEAIFLFLGFQAGDRWADQAVLRIKQAGGGAASPSLSYAPGPRKCGWLAHGATERARVQFRQDMGTTGGGREAARNG